MLSRPINIFLKFALILLLAFLAFKQIQYIVSAGPLYDDGYNASVAKNIAKGYGNVTSYNELIRNNPEVTTGPALLLPLAALIKAVGNTYWAPSLVLGLVSFGLLLCFIFVFLKKNGTNNLQLFSIFLFLSFIIFGATELPGEKEIWVPFRIWLQFLGEIPAVLLSLIGFLYVRGEKKKFFLAGVMWGLALHCKVIVLIPMMAALGLVFLSEYWFQVKSFLRDYRGLFLGVLSTKLFFALVFLILPQKEATNLTFKHFLDFIKVGGSGLEQVSKRPDFLTGLINTLSNNTAVLRQFLGGNTGLILLFLLALVGSLSIFKHFRRLQAYHYLLIGGLGHLCWWLFLSNNGWMRHLQPGLFILVLGFICLAMRTGTKVKVFIFASMSLITAIKFVDSTQGISYEFKKNERLISLEKTSEYLAKLRENSSDVLLGCGWWANRDLEYVMPEVLNFYDCQKLQKDPAKTFYLVKGYYWNWGKDPNIEMFEKACGSNLVFESGEFTVTKCM